MGATPIHKPFCNCQTPLRILKGNKESIIARHGAIPYFTVVVSYNQRRKAVKKNATNPYDFLFPLVIRAFFRVFVCRRSAGSIWTIPGSRDVGQQGLVLLKPSLKNQLPLHSPNHF
jgi:hypothetical protein